MHLEPTMARVILYSRPNSLLHLRSDVVCTVLEMAYSSASTLTCRLGRRSMNWATVSRFHPRTIFKVNQDPYPCPSFLREMGSFLPVSVSSLGNNNLSILWKRC